MNTSNKRFNTPTRSGPSAAATWTFIVCLAPFVAIGAAHLLVWLWELVAGLAR